jgi:hypothetical protein
LIELAQLKAEIVAYIEVALVELKATAQPRDIAEFRELAMDAEDADSVEGLNLIQAQAKNLREFCEKRARSTGHFPSVFPPAGRRST